MTATEPGVGASPARAEDQLGYGIAANVISMALLATRVVRAERQVAPS